MLYNYLLKAIHLKNTILLLWYCDKHSRDFAQAYDQSQFKKKKERTKTKRQKISLKTPGLKHEKKNLSFLL